MGILHPGLQDFLVVFLPRRRRLPANVGPHGQPLAHAERP